MFDWNALRWPLLACTLLACSALSVNAQAPAAPSGPTPTPAAEVEPFRFDPALPTMAIGWVNGQEVPASKLLELVLDQNFNQGVSTILSGKMLDIELEKAGVKLPEEAIQEELREMVEKTAPGKTLEEVIASGSTSERYLREAARTQRGWMLLFWEKQSIPADQRTAEGANPLLMRLYMQQMMGQYERRVRGSAPAPTPPFVAEVKELGTGKSISVDANEALDFLIGLVRPNGLAELQRQLLEQIALEQALQKAGAQVTDTEIQTWVNDQIARHPPPFTWDQICRFKGTTPEREKQRWMRIQAWKRITDAEVDPAKVDAFLQENKGFFLGDTKRVSHILIRTVDEVSGAPYEAERAAAAKTTIDALYEKAMEGLDFAWLAKTYSEDAMTARGEGRLAQQIKQWGGGLDPEFQRTAWELTEVGQISKPVLSQFGWHVLKLDEYARPSKTEPDWKSPRYQEWVTDEYETKEMEAYMAKLMKESELRPAPAEVLMKLKEISYVNK